MAVFGIMTHRTRHKNKFSLYAKEAAKLGFESTVVFTPHQVDLNRKRISALRFEPSGRWIPCVCRFPDIVHDVGFYTVPRTIRRVKTIKSAASGLPFTGYALGHKWEIHSKLLQTPYAAYLPETKLVRSPHTVVACLKRFGTVIVKPRDGKQGRDIVKIRRNPEHDKAYLWKEGDRPTEGMSQVRLFRTIDRRFKPGKAIVQRWMDIRSPKGGVYDIRALVQKTEGNVWRITEMAVRQSGLGRIASNVTSGGTVKPLHNFLTGLYGEAGAGLVAEQCRTIAAGLPGELEKQYGKRFVELGIDLAVERGGKVRLIEVNIKPGKKIVRALSGEEAYADAVLIPVRYARWLSDRRDSLWMGS